MKAVWTVGTPGQADLRIYARPSSHLDDLRVGAYLTINGVRRMVLRKMIGPAPEDDPELGVVAGDLVADLELSEGV